jgi:hypothetical protein
MNGSMVIQGRSVGPEALDRIRGLLAEHGDWHRTRLSRELCALWNWRNAAGQPKDMACRSLLLKLEARGWIRLPARRAASVNAFRHRSAPRVAHPREPIAEPLRDLLAVDIRIVESSSEDADLLRGLMARYHYLGLRSAAGENLRYLVRDRRGRVLGCLWFAAAAWRCKDRDRFIGWEDGVRARNLPLLANNTRFLILPWVRVPHLASHLLGKIARRIDQDWQHKYGHGLYALETFVDRERFTGACYRAANWLKVGQTTGRTRNDVVNAGPLSSIKDVYVYPLARRFRQMLCTPEPALGETMGC